MRAKGEGTIYRQADGLWAAAITINGKRLVKRAKKQTDVREWLSDYRAKADQGMVSVKGRGVTLARFLPDWLDATKPTVKPNTYRIYARQIDGYLVPEIGKLKLHALRPDHVQALYGKLLDSGLSGASVQLCHEVLHHALKDAATWGLVPRNVATLAKVPKADHPEMSVWTADEARQFIEHVHGQRYEGLYVLALTAGLRLGEIVGLRWEDINLKAATLQVRRTLTRVGRDRLIGEPKTASGQRQIILTEFAVGTLQRWRKRQLQDRLLAGERWREQGYVFTGTIGTPVVDHTLRSDFHKQTALCGVPRIRFHDLRHTCASLLLSSNVHPKVVQRMLGHSKVSITLDVYSHILPGLEEQAVKQLERVLELSATP